MRSLFVTYQCEDITGIYYTHVEIQRKEINDQPRYVAYYADFPNIVSITRYRHHLDYWIPAIITTMLAEESGIVPKVRYHNQRLVAEV